MKLILYVHDFHPQIGHSRAMIELINALNPDQKNQIQNIEVVSYTTSDLNNIFPNFKNKKFTKVPFQNLKPFILKMFFYHIFTFFHYIKSEKSDIKIGIGIASLFVDITNIQFIHQQWEPIFFKQRNLKPLSLVYKKILFHYFAKAENFLFTSNKLKFIVIANFISEYIESKFRVSKNNIHFIASAVNADEFKIPTKATEDVFNELLSEYPTLQILDPNLPIAIFAGAFERKGLDRALEYLSTFPETQFIIIGKPENENNWTFPKNLRIARINFTKKIDLFYAISDLFIFPTYYEPFGLVIIEAYAMGLDLIIPHDNVGASEIIKALPGIHFYHQNQPLPDYKFSKLSKEEKLNRRAERLNQLENITWEQGAIKFFKILEDVRSLK